MSRTRRMLLSAFIAIHLVLIALWAFPVNGALTELLHRVVGPYFLLAGLRQEWSLFAPDPMMANSYVDAQVILQNGDTRTWSFPQLEELGFGERYSKARYRKYTGWLYRRAYRYAWPDAARYVARQFQGSASPPRTVKLLRRWFVIPPYQYADDPPEWHSDVFFVYQVRPGDLP